LPGAPGQVANKGGKGLKNTYFLVFRRKAYLPIFIVAFARGYRCSALPGRVFDRFRLLSKLTMRYRFTLFWALPALLLLGSCSHKFYAPNTHAVPLVQQQGEARASGMVWAGNELSGVELQGAYALTNRVGMMVNVIAAKGGEVGDTKSGNGYLLEAGSGYFRPGGQVAQGQGHFVETVLVRAFGNRSQGATLRVGQRQPHPVRAGAGGKGKPEGSTVYERVGVGRYQVPLGLEVLADVGRRPVVDPEPPVARNA
jgi:hypothetical protein